MPRVAKSGPKVAEWIDIQRQRKRLVMTAGAELFSRRRADRTGFHVQDRATVRACEHPSTSTSACRIPTRLQETQ